jgi:hypothetical protein
VSSAISRENGDLEILGYGAFPNDNQLITVTD